MQTKYKDCLELSLSPSLPLSLSPSLSLPQPVPSVLPPSLSLPQSPQSSLSLSPSHLPRRLSFARLSTSLRVSSPSLSVVLPLPLPPSVTEAGSSHTSPSPSPSPPGCSMEQLHGAAPWRLPALVSARRGPAARGLQGSVPDDVLLVSLFVLLVTGTTGTGGHHVERCNVSTSRD